ncbi:ankyrin repeat-containing domain protein, partial [Gautieria morchelliformis]
MPVACARRRPLWFVEGEYFQEWREAPHSFLWLRGIPGAGKTILCSTIVEDLSLHCRSDPSLAIAFFYFDFNNKDTLPNAVLRSLIEQLSVQCVSIPYALESLFSKDEHGSAHQDPGQEDLMSTLKTIITGFQAVYIVFDALDECPERTRFLMVIRDIHGWEFELLHLLVTSRKERDIEEMLGGLISHEMPMDKSLVDNDIQVHVTRTLEDDVKFSMCSAEEKEMVKTTLMYGACGMFRWVVCQLDALWKCKTPGALKEALRRLPKTLNETYDRILTAIDEDDKQPALSLLQWLAFSFNTLSINQAVDVIATDPDATDEPLFDMSRRLQDPQDILTICSSLVTITFQEDSRNKGSIDHHANRVLSTEAGEIRLAHFSVQEYLISEHLRTSMTMLSYYYFNEQIAHVFIVKTCLAYLLQFDQDNGVNWNTAKSYPLSYYAAYNWMVHASWDPAGDWDDLHRLIMMLLEPTSAVYINWMWLCHKGDTLAHPGKSSLCIAAEAGALEVAAIEGHDTIVQLLIEKGAIINARGTCCMSALEAAASRGHDTIAQLLIEKDADVNAQGGHYGSALNAAALEGHYSIVQLFLEKGADVNAQGRCYGGALQAAASRGHDMIVQLLLEKGADVNGHGGGHMSALEAAASGGHDMSVQLLIENGANVAASHGHDTIVQLLLEKGTDVNSEGGYYGNALNAAAAEGQDTTVRLLLEKGANVNAQGGYYGNALNAAATEGHDTIVQLLVERGANINAQGGVYSGALQAAVV